MFHFSLTYSPHLPRTFTLSVSIPRAPTLQTSISSCHDSRTGPGLAPTLRERADDLAADVTESLNARPTDHWTAPVGRIAGEILEWHETSPGGNGQVATEAIL